MDAQNLQPFIDKGLRDVINKVQYNALELNKQHPPTTKTDDYRSSANGK